MHRARRQMMSLISGIFDEVIGTHRRDFALPQLRSGIPCRQRPAPLHWLQIIFRLSFKPGAVSGRVRRAAPHIRASTHSTRALALAGGSAIRTRVLSSKVARGHGILCRMSLVSLVTSILSERIRTLTFSHALISHITAQYIQNC